MIAAVKRNAFRIAAVVWLILWMNFLFRDLFTHGAFREYSELLRRNYDEKRSFTYGEPFYELLSLSKASMPDNATYELRGIESLSLAHRRGVYYLYPALERPLADYVLYFRDVNRGTGLLERKTGYFRKFKGAGRDE